MDRVQETDKLTQPNRDGRGCGAEMRDKNQSFYSDKQKLKECNCVPCSSIFPAVRMKTQLELSSTMQE